MDNELLQLIAAKLLPVGSQVYCSVPDVIGTVDQGGLLVAGQVFTDPTTAMRAVLRDEMSSSSGWQFWHLPDPERQSIQPLEHLRIALRAKQQTGQIKTSLTHPLRVDWLQVRDYTGRIGMTFCPGKRGPGLYGGRWERDLTQDLQALKAAGTTALITLLEPHEFPLLGVPDFREAVEAESLEWHWREIRDSGIPDERFESAWPALAARLHHLLANGHHVVVHCRGGLGRTGMAVARFMVEEGYAAEEATRLVRAARPGAIETWAQEQYVRSQNPAA